MTPYAEQTTEALIALLLTEEDRVTATHIQELVTRPDATAPLCEILANEDYWYEGEDGEWWVTMHALTILALQRDPQALPSMLKSLYFSWDVMNDWVASIYSYALARLGEAAITPLMDYILATHNNDLDDDNWSYARTDAARALTIIALEHPASRERILQFLCDLLTGSEEEDGLFLNFILSYPIKLDPTRGLAAAQIAFARVVIDETIQGSYDDIVRDVAREGAAFGEPLDRDLWRFYQPEEIARRQERWERERVEEANRAATGRSMPAGRDDLFRGWDYGDDSGELADMLGFGLPAHPPANPPSGLPDGYTRAADGKLLKSTDVGRNEPCPCGSGKKYKKCCGK